MFWASGEISHRRVQLTQTEMHLHRRTVLITFWHIPPWKTFQEEKIKKGGNKDFAAGRWGKYTETASLEAKKLKKERRKSREEITAIYCILLLPAWIFLATDTRTQTSRKRSRKKKAEKTACWFLRRITSKRKRESVVCFFWKNEKVREKGCGDFVLAYG